MIGIALRRDCPIAGYAVSVRCIQYNRTASFLAAATLATAFDFLCARCRYSRLNSGSSRTVVCAASTSSILIRRLPRLVIEPSLCLPPELCSEGRSRTQTRPATGDWVFAKKIMVAVGPNRWLVRWPNSLHRN
jgi:hypothetical protein